MLDEVVTKIDLSKWHPVIFFFRKMILTETWYKTHNDKLLAIVKVFKTWQQYLKDCKYKVLVLTDYNNLRRFIDTENLSSKKVYWAQKFSCYYFCINYQQSKASGDENALSQYSLQNAKEEAIC